MRFKIKINKWANFYFFIQNISEWHFSNRKEYNLTWRNELGKFSKKEEKYLLKFKNIRLKYKFKSIFENAFFKSNRPWFVLNKYLSVKDFNTVKEIFKEFKPKFNLLYKKELPNLKIWKKNLEKINNKKINNSIIKDLSLLYNLRKLNNEISVYVLISAGDKTGGGANIDNTSVSIEISRCHTNKIDHILGIIWHETIHLLFERVYFNPLLEEFSGNDRDKFNLIREAVASSLFPNGILGIKFFNVKEIKLNNKIPKIYNKKIIFLSKNYLSKNKFFDKSYFQKLFSYIYKLKGILK